MGIFGKIEQVARYTQNAAEKAVEIGKIKVKILRKNDEIRHEKQKIGEIIFEKHNAHEEIPLEVVERCEKISDLSAEIEILSNAIDAIKSQTDDDCCCQECPNCGEIGDCCANFCSNCGTKFDDCCECDDECGCEDSCDCGENQ